MNKRTLLIYVVTVALALCLVLVSLLFTGPTQGERMAMDALECLGKPYVLGQRGPETYDCSGLVITCAAREGIPGLPHSAAELYGLGRPVALPALLPGDMVCFDTVQDGDACDHVGFYLGGNRFVHASSARDAVVVTALTDYYLEHYSGARRLACAYL